MSVYFVRRTRDDFIKIGWCEADVYDRAMGLRSEVRSNLRILGTMPGGYAQEQSTHQRFAHLRRDGEWFEADDDLLGFIRENASPWDGPPTVGQDQPDEYWTKSRYDRRNESLGADGEPAGTILAENLMRLGYARVNVTEVAQRTGVVRQQISTLLNSRRISMKMIRMLADGLGVEPEELMKTARRVTKEAAR
jgi:plasmid maintenance system antidote protein VapI